MRRTRLFAAAILPLVNLVAQAQNRSPRASSCDAMRKRLERTGPHMAMIDMIPDLVRDSGIVTDSEELATAGRPVNGIAADGASIALLRFPANFIGERLRVTILDGFQQPSTSTSENGALSKIDATESGRTVPFASFRFESGPAVVKAVKTPGAVMVFVLYLAPSDFNRAGLDSGEQSRSLSFRVESLDVPCFAFTWPRVRPLGRER